MSAATCWISGPAALTKIWRADTLPVVQAYGLYLPGLDVHAGDLPAQQANSGQAGLFQQVAAKLLPAKPTSPADVQGSHGLVAQIGEVAVQQGGVQDQIGAVGLVLEAGWRGRVVRWVVKTAGVDA
jgi:hypothetical protein